MSTEKYIWTNALLNVICPGVLIVVELYFHCKFSGVPFRSQDMRKRLVRINLIMVFWGMARGVSGGLGLAKVEDQQQIFKDILNYDSSTDSTLIAYLIGPVVFVSELMLLEVLPILLIADSKTIENFYIKEEIFPRQVTESSGNSVSEPLIGSVKVEPQGRSTLNLTLSPPNSIPT